MNYMDFEPHLIRQRNEEMLREVHSLRLKEQLRTNREPRDSSLWPGAVCCRCCAGRCLRSGEVIPLLAATGLRWCSLGKQMPTNAHVTSGSLYLRDGGSEEGQMSFELSEET